MNKDSKYIEIMKQLEYKTIGGVLLRLCGVVKRLSLKYRKWRVMNEIRQLDFDMQCTNMTYKQYEVEYNRLSKQYDNLQ
jgi:hypothetical protein